jgi:glycosyltransferase involved in cell wall biosynthesis
LKIVYLVSTLAASGPTNQLYNIVLHLDKSFFDPIILTLSPEPSASRWKDFIDLGVEVQSLGLSRFKGLIFGKNKLKDIVNSVQPDLIHSQGLRADSLLASLSLNYPWVITSRNFPPDDYLSKFGRLKGSFMVWQHFSAMKHCQHLVTCSKTIQEKLAGVGIQGTAIQNGVRLHSNDVVPVSFFANFPRPIFVSVGSLIPRKNMKFLLDSFAQMPEAERGSLVILGNGSLMEDLRARSCPNVHLVGSVSNVNDYLAGAGYFVSSSLSEGLPNTVLEALAAGLPVILSDIESHLEIAGELSKAGKIFSLQEGVNALSQAMLSATKDFDNSSRAEAKSIATKIFSAEGMSVRYQALYKSILETL